MNELDVAIYSRLSGDATLMALIPGGIHNPIAPHAQSESLAFPVLVFGALPGQDMYTFTGRWEEIDYSFRAGVKGLDAAPVWAILDRVFALVQDYTFTVSGHTLMYARRRSREGITDVSEQGINYIQGAARYHFEVQPA